MKRRLATRKALARLAHVRELAAMQRLAENLVARSDALATHQVELDEYDILSNRYADATESGRTLDLSRYENLGELVRLAETRLNSTANRVEETGTGVEKAGAALAEASKRRDTHEDRLGKMEARLRAADGNRDQFQLLETWMQTRPQR